MPRYALQTRDDPPVCLFTGDSVAECRKVAEMRVNTYGNERAVIVRHRDGWIDELDGYGFCRPAEYLATLEREPPGEIQSAISDDPKAARRVLRYLDDRGVAHSGQISGATLAAVCGVNGRTWRKWIGEERGFPTTAARLLVAIAFGRG